MMAARRILFDRVVILVFIGVPFFVASTTTSGPVGGADSNAIDMISKKYPSVAFQCVSNHFNASGMETMMKQYLPPQYKGEPSAGMRDMMDVVCRDHLLPFIICMEKSMKTSSYKVDSLMRKLIDFSRLRALVQYICDRKDAISKNFACLQQQDAILADPEQSVPVALEYKKCLSATKMDVHIQEVTRQKTFDETVIKEAFQSGIKAAKCRTPAYKKCGNMADVYEHMVGEMAGMLKGEKTGTSGGSAPSITMSLVATIVGVILNDRM